MGGLFFIEPNDCQRPYQSGESYLSSLKNGCVSLVLYHHHLILSRYGKLVHVERLHLPRRPLLKIFRSSSPSELSNTQRLAVMHDQERQPLSHTTTAKAEIDQLEGPAGIIQSCLWHALGFHTTKLSRSGTY